VPRHIKIGLIVLGVGFAITLGLFVDIVGRIQSMTEDKEIESNPFTPPAASLYSPMDPPMMAKIFFPALSGNVLLSAEDQMIFRSAELTNRAKQILQKLIDGPTAVGLKPSVPKDTKVQEVFVDDTGMAYVDFSTGLVTNYPGGLVNEQATIYSIVNSLTYNLPEIRQVKILIGGAEHETLAGHCLLLPLGMDLSITNVSPPEEPAPHAAN
jgi:hypothetical protein